MAQFVAPLACAAISILVFYNTLDAGFVYDDNRAILANEDVRWSSSIWSILTHDFWGTPLSHAGSHKSWRPLTVFSFRINHLLNGLRPQGFHVTNILLHAIVTVLFLSWARLVVPHGFAALLATIIFAIHPIHCEAVAGVVGRAELACTACILIALILHRTHIRARDTSSPHRAIFFLSLTIIFSVLASLFKEQGLVTLVLCAICDIISCSKIKEVLKFNDKLKAMRFSIYILMTISVMFLTLRISVMGGTLPKFASADNPAAHSKSFLTRTLTFLYLPVFNFMLFICPTTLSFDWSMNAIPLIERWSDVRNLQSIIFYFGFTILVLREILVLLSSKPHCRGVGYALAVIVVTFLPASNLAGYVGFVAAERVMYAPSLGLSLLLGIGISRVWNHFRNQASRRTLLSVSLLLLVICLAARTWRRNEDWKNEEALYRSGLTVNPPKAYGNLGSVLSTTGKTREAEECYRRALYYRPNMADVHYNLGLLLLQEEARLDEAVQCFQAAIACRPKLAAAHVSLGVALGRQGKAAEALDVLQRAAHLDSVGLRDPRAHESARASALFHLGRLQLEQGQPQNALSAFLRAKDVMPSNFQPQSVYNLLGETYSRLGRIREAESWIQASLNSRPDHIPAHLTYAKLLAFNKSRVHEAEGWFQRALQLAPSDTSVLRHYGEFLIHQGHHRRAAHVLERVLNLTVSPRYHDLVNTATALRMAGDIGKAVELYLGARDINPQDPTSHANLGAALHLAGKLREAEESYKRALYLRPNDEITRMNLERLHRLKLSQKET